MNDRQLEDRGSSLHDALERMRERRDDRPEVPSANLTFGVRDLEQSDQRRGRGLFRFGDRGRDAIEPGSTDA